MACRTALLIAIATAFLAAPSARAQGAGEPTGVWLTQAGDARVRVSKCGGGICGTIVGLRDPIDPATGKPQVDDKIRIPALRKRPVIGLSLFSGMQPVAAGKWSGQIYNAEDGGIYASSVSLTGPDSAPCRRLRRRAVRRRNLDSRRTLRTSDGHRLQRRRGRSIAAAGAVDEMHVIAAHHRRRKTGHHRGVLTVQTVAHDAA